MEIINDRLVWNEDEWIDEFLKRLESIKNKRGMTWKELSEKSGISQQSLRYWKRNRQMPKVTNVIKVAAVFDCDPAYLLLIRDSDVPFCLY